MGIILGGILCLVLHDLEEDYPLFHPQDEGTLPNYYVYLCYRYPRPSYWVWRAIGLVLGKEGACSTG